jgi:thiamine biosynthesis lipoprotein
MSSLPSTWLVLCAAALAVGGTRPADEPVTREAWAMGTRVRIVADGPDRMRSERATEAALLELERLERMLSTWDAGSELSALNRAALGAPVAVAPELAGLLEEAEAWAQRTGRAFDPAVGALVDAWGVRGPPRTPDPYEVVEALSATGPRVLEWVGGKAVRGAADGWIDSGGFGKGAALRAIARMVHMDGDERLLVDVGGQFWASAPAGAPWSIEVAHPRERERPVARIEVRGVSVATSGSSERPGHLLDPRSGVPAPAWGSVTVVHPDALEADILSTALYVLGPAAGLAWAASEGVAALFVQEEGKGLGLTWTEEMEQWLVEVTRNQVSFH